MKSSYWVILVIGVILLGGYFLMRGGGIYSAPSNAMAVTGIPTVTPEPNSFTGESNDPNKGNYLTDTRGIALYTFANDQADVSNCSGTCAQNWPAYTTPATPSSALPADLGTFTRTDGIIQFTWKGMPLYFYSGDQKAGDTNGDGIGGVWHMVIL